MYVEYSSNNSGGYWWLKDKDWKALEKAGWVIRWGNLTVVFHKGKKDKYPQLVREKSGIPKFRKRTADDKDICDADGRFLGALATTAYRECVRNPGESNRTMLQRVAEEWESITGGNSTAAGCSCCGQPHNFSLHNEKGDQLEYGL